MDLVGHQEVVVLRRVVARHAGEEARHLDDARRLLVVGQPARPGEQRRVVLRDLYQRVVRRRVLPDLRQTVVRARIFLDQDRTVRSHRQIVHHDLTFAAVEQHADRAA